MSLENPWAFDKHKANHALELAKGRNAKKVVPIKVNGYTTVLVTKEQAEDKLYIERLKRNLNAPSIFFDVE